MNGVELERFSNDKALAQAAAGGLLAIAASARPGLRPVVALSGGRSASVFFSELAALAKARPGALDKVEFFWADERHAPPDSPESNFGLARDLLFAPLGIPAENIHRVR